MPSYIHAHKIPMYSTDAAGFVFFANYYSIMHECYENWLWKQNIYLSEMFLDKNILLPVKSSNCRYFKPIYLEQDIQINMKCIQISETDFTLEYRFFTKDDQILSKGKIEHVCICSKTHKRLPLPAELAESLKKIHHA